MVPRKDNLFFPIVVANVAVTVARSQYYFIEVLSNLNPLPALKRSKISIGCNQLSLSCSAFSKLSCQVHRHAVLRKHTLQFLASVLPVSPEICKQRSFDRTHIHGCTRNLLQPS